MSYISTAVPDESAFSAGTSPLTPGGGVFDDTLPAISAGQTAQFRITESRAAHVNLRREDGTEIGTVSDPLQVAIPTGSPIDVNVVSPNPLPVDGSGVTQPVSGAVDARLQDGSGNLISSTAGSLDVNITAGGGGGLVRIEDTAGNALTSTGGALDQNLVTLAGTAIDTNSGVKSAGTQRIVIATDQPILTNALKISAAALPLPTGASTAAKQPALGTAGAASADVISIQGIASMTAVKVDGSAVTQPVSAASLPLPTGAATAAKQPALGTAGASSADVITVQGRASMTPLNDNLTQLAGTAVDVNSGVKSAGTLRVVLATDQPLPANVCEQVTASGDTIRRRFVADLHQTTLFSLTNVYHTFLTGSPRYFIQNVNVQLDPLMTFPGGGAVVVLLNDTTDGVLFQWFMYLPNAAAAPTVASNYVLNTPPDWFYKATTNTSSLQLKANVNPAGSNFAVNIAYGLTSL